MSSHIANTEPLLLDMDGPLADFDQHFYDRCIERGFTFDVRGPEFQQHRYFTEHLPDRRERKMARAMVDAPGWFGSLPVTPGATDGVARLLDAGVDVWVCTKPLEVNPTCHHDKFHWLNRHFPALAERLVICPDKSLMRGAVLLDDAPKPHWFKVALWEPVIFPAPFNASQFDGVRRWSWSDPVADLFGAVS